MRRHQAAEAPPGAAGAHFCSDLEVEQTGFEPSVPLGSGSAGKVERHRRWNHQNLRKLQISAAIEKAQSKRAERVAATADPTTIAAEI